jgi:hypothetical protein
MQLTYTCYNMASKSVDEKKIAFGFMSEIIACVNSPTDSHYMPNVGVGLIINFPGLIPRLTTASKLPVPLPKVAKHAVKKGQICRAGVSDAVGSAAQPFLATARRWLFINQKIIDMAYK